MAGGWGYSVQAPMEVPQEPPVRYLDDDMPGAVDPREQPLPEMKNTDTNMLRRLNKALPPRPGGEVTMKGRMEDAAEYANVVMKRERAKLQKMYSKGLWDGSLETLSSDEEE